MKKPWVKFFAGDFLNGVADLDAEQRGAYVTVLCLIWDRGGPIPDDSKWLARRVGVGSRKWASLRSQLLELGKIETDGDGNLTNRRAMRDLRERAQISEKRSEAAEQRWNGSRDLFTNENNEQANASASNGANRSQKGESERFQGKKSAIFSPLSGDGRAKAPAQEMAENSHSRDASASVLHPIPSRARAFQSPEARDSTPTNEPPSRARAREGSADGGPGSGGLYDLTLACCEAAGMAGRIASRPALLAQSMDIVKGWQASGVDVSGLAVPLITAAVDRMDEPAHSLAKFAAAIDTAHAKAKRHAKRNGSKPPMPDGAPILEFADEAPTVAPFRAALAEALPRAVYPRLCNRVRFSATDLRHEGDGACLIVTPRARNGWTANDPAEQLLANHGERLRQLARQHLGSQQVLAREAPCVSPSEQPQ